ncbi:hypothetical protein K450DRAFT_274515 [Umbelopsis ramanniana AG]|uniref:Uncharacterized protein n=1 Tax=Umbelopsis ramanniana AG TaxID=1314678 RepID=A0AAD5E594_UMBRA|nr:uncharacterized protein K450DRAFT_274515 [Umbelopsis ramanniana AG]KAI8576605.1 hypothetical protein K450DRAFT_274515 [Umbelopsis ramanniana AG]
MRSAISILICSLYALCAVDATSISEGGNTLVEKDIIKAAEPQQLWSEVKSDDDGEVDHKDGKDGKGGKGGHKSDEYATRSVSILIGSSTFAIPCLGAGSIVDINGFIPIAFPSLLPIASDELISLMAPFSKVLSIYLKAEFFTVHSLYFQDGLFMEHSLYLLDGLFMEHSLYLQEGLFTVLSLYLKDG